LAGVSRAYAFALVAASYVMAGTGAAAAAVLLRGYHPIAVALAADLVGTVIVFGKSMVLANSSVYDPYWSVVPPVVAFGWLTGTSVRQVAVVVLVVAWGVRLTANWARS
jgi:steroid 5-alpha reductase family enzyme